MRPCRQGSTDARDPTGNTRVMGLAEAVGMVNIWPRLDHRRLVCDMRVINTPALTDRYNGGPSCGAHCDDGLR